MGPNLWWFGGVWDCQRDNRTRLSYRTVEDCVPRDWAPDLSDGSGIPICDAGQSDECTVPKQEGPDSRH